MKSFKKTSQVLFALMAIVTVLPGCGKSKGPDVAAQGVAGTVYPAGMLQGSCYNFYNIPQGQGATLTFSGQGFIMNGQTQGWLPGAAVGFPGAHYTRTNNISGDSVNLFVSGTTMHAQANLAPFTVDYFRSRGMQVCGLSMNNNQITGNQILYSVYVYSNMGYSGISL